jgi:hypothetical protein
MFSKVIQFIDGQLLFRYRMLFALLVCTDGDIAAAH